MARAPGLIRRRGQSWNVVIRLDGERHEFGPRSEPLLSKASTKKQVEEWVWRKHAELRDEAKKAVEREANDRPEYVPSVYAGFGLSVEYGNRWIG